MMEVTCLSVLRVRAFSIVIAQIAKDRRQNLASGTENQRAFQKRRIFLTRTPIRTAPAADLTPALLAYLAATSLRIMYIGKTSLSAVDVKIAERADERRGNTENRIVNDEC